MTTGKVLTAYPGSDVSGIAPQMVERHVQSVPVIDAGEVERQITAVLVRTVPGVGDSRIGQPVPEP